MQNCGGRTRTYPKKSKRLVIVKQQVLLRLADGLSTQGTASIQNSHFLVSRQRVKDFIGRESLLDKIRSHFSGKTTRPPPLLILHALGGQGKSQIALEYCRKRRDSYRGIFWIDANSEMTATRSYAKIAAEVMGKSWIDIGENFAQVKLVKDHLEQWDEESLLVFDNYDEPRTFSEISAFIPSSRRISVDNCQGVADPQVRRTRSCAFH